MATFDFYPLTIPYLKQMHQWLQAPHVRAFWDRGDRTLEQVRKRYFETTAFERYLILHNKQTVGYVQAEPILANHALAKFRPKDTQVFVLDLFFGEAEYIGKGMGMALLSDFIAYLRERHHQLGAVFFAPLQNNPRAIHLLVKFGAKPIGLFEDKEVLMLDLKGI